MNYRANLYYEYVELIIPGVLNTGNLSPTFTFNDQAQIRTTPIYSICVYTPSVMAVSPLSGTTMMPLPNMKGCFLTLNQNDPNNGVNKNGIDLIPLLELNYINDGTSPYVWQQPMFGGQIVLWDKSWVTAKVALANTVNWAIVLGVRYGYPEGVQGATGG